MYMLFTYYYVPCLHFFFSVSFSSFQLFLFFSTLLYYVLPLFLFVLLPSRLYGYFSLFLSIFYLLFVEL